MIPLSHNRDARVIATLQAGERVKEYDLAAVRGSVLRGVMGYAQEVLDATPRWRLITRARLRIERDLMLAMYEQHVGQQMLALEDLG